MVVRSAPAERPQFLRFKPRAFERLWSERGSLPHTGDSISSFFANRTLGLGAHRRCSLQDGPVRRGVITNTFRRRTPSRRSRQPLAFRRPLDQGMNYL